MPTSSVRATACLVVLALLFTVNQWSRSILFYLVDFAQQAGGAVGTDASRLFMNVDLGFDQAQYGILASISFAALFSIASFIAGGAVDRIDPRNILSASGLLWSAAMAWQASARSFSDLLSSRLLLGFSQAFCNPAAYTALGQIFAPDQRATAFGIYSAGVYFGGALAALSILLDAALGWRGINFLAAVIGAAVAVATFVVLPPLPPRGAAEPQLGSAEKAATSAAAGSSTPSVADATDDDIVDELTALEPKPQTPAALPVLEGLKELFSSSAVRWLLFGSALRFMAGFCIGVWVVPFYRAAFPAQIGVRFALLKASVNGVAGSVSASGGGFLTDKLSGAEPRVEQWIPAAGSLLAVPFWLGTLYSDSLELSLAALFVEYLVAECWLGPTVASIQRAAPDGAKGLAQGVFSTLTLAGNLAPTLVGYLVTKADVQLTTALAYTVPALYVASALAFVVAGERVRDESESVETVGGVDANGS